MSVTGPTPPKVPQAPSVRAASERSTTLLVASTPAPASVPSSRVSGTEVVVYQGSAGEVDRLAGRRRCASAATVHVAVPVRPAPFVAVIVTVPGSSAPADQS